VTPVPKEYKQIEWDAQAEDDCRQLIRLAVREDLDRLYDWTTVALVAEGVAGQANVVARARGVIAGLRAAKLTLEEYDPRLEWSPRVADGDAVEPGQVVAHVAGPARSLLTAERPLLNMLGRLSGIATLTRRYVDAVAGTGARIFDTRKTMPGWRRLEKLAVRAGGGWNHRLGLFDGVLIKDNHLAFGAAGNEGDRFTPAEAIARVRRFMAGMAQAGAADSLLIEVEVDSLAQLDEVLPLAPDCVLLDNMPADLLRQAVARRDAVNPAVQLEASGGVTLASVREIADSGVDRISVGALTHSAPWFDVALDWLE
jgi:nicotinate-nucleotide pyrophosphorylase (carboxylating)